VVEPSEEPGAEKPPVRDRRRLLAGVGVGLGIVLVLVFLVVGLTNSGGVGSRIDGALAEGERPPAPDLALPVLIPGPSVGPEDAQVSLRDFAGRVVVVNVWASWCVPCKVEAPVLEAIWRDYRSRGVLVLGIDFKDFSRDALAFAREQKLTFPSLRDGDGDKTEDALEILGVPETLVIDQQGRIALAVRGVLSRDQDVAAFRQQLESLL
jgi:thiol-disulfide isomerase/thioredoxin